MVDFKRFFESMAGDNSVLRRDPRLGPQEVRDKAYDALVRQRQQQLIDEHKKVLRKEIVEYQRVAAARQINGDGTSFIQQKKVRPVKEDMTYYGKSNLLR